MLRKAAPVLASLNIQDTLQFYVDKLRFRVVHEDPDYGIISRNHIELHFWKCDDPIHPKNTSCYIYVEDIDALYEEMEAEKVIHPNGKIADRPWGMREFAILDLHGNLIKFGQTRVS